MNIPSREVFGIDYRNFDAVKELAIKLSSPLNPQAVIENPDGSFRITHGTKGGLARSIFRNPGKIRFNTQERE